MKIHFPEAIPSAPALVLVTPQDGPTTPAVEAVDRATGGQLGRALRAAEFVGRKGATLELLAPPGLDHDRLLLLGLGPPQEADALVFEELGGRIVEVLGTRAAAVAVDLSGLPTPRLALGAAAAHLALGALLRAWRHDRYRTTLKDEDRPRLAELAVAGAARAAEAFAPLDAVARGVFLTRELVTEPANVIFPESFVERVRAAAEPLGLEITVLDEVEMKALGMGCLLGVAQGSVRPPRLLALEWNGTGDSQATPALFVGKGVTFDTGGISIKPASGMEDMKWDMGGAAAVAGAMVALAARRARARVVGVCGLVENMPDGGAQRPGDVVTSFSGKTVEVINTDAEGRLVLADAMAWAQQRWQPDVMVDLATLTGAIIVSLGHEYAGLFTPHDDLAAQLSAAGDATGERVWRQPLGKPGSPYDKLLESAIADMKNVGPREAGSITAAQFLQRFVADGVQWAHLDIAGTVWKTKPGPTHGKGATGFGVRLIDRFVAQTRETAA
ncbi:MAG: leucyl aminopeptidase [Sphingomonadaceae bacterium]|uniref:leucyl aminopeptidase n=1 Tax=Thermaurantiacus sp. TaxID=2820283 RepID=UPI00298F2F58|nr:leucyl aminopeptidase [Thermaurantiacus sp.]MCS6986973.1 leucyl aminopeptidase [Sphingomonadaceae bacterium]MDW8415427.1 leucyl aminopeptidase [Thermaurantiacus sp.]